MSRQMDLFGPPELQLRPEAGRTEPRLWVRRLVVWSAPGVVVREVALRPGLNIVWSPDPSDVASSVALGHGSGKTLLCRLLRYGLGEDHPASAELRTRLLGAFPAGRVGVEVAVDDAVWSIVRPLAGQGGPGAGVARAGVGLEALAAAEEQAEGGLGAFFGALEGAFLPPEVTRWYPEEALPARAGERLRRTWLACLAWLTRDQECRLIHPLEWRAAASGSRSPVLDLSPADQLVLVRALLRAADAREHEVLAELERTGAALREARRARAFCERATEELRGELRAELLGETDAGMAGPLLLDPLRRAVRERLAARTHADAATSADLGALRRAREEADAALEALRADAVQTSGWLRVELARVEGELGAAALQLRDEGAGPVCLICALPLDQALAAGCGAAASPCPPEHLQRLRDRRAALLERRDALARDLDAADAAARTQADRLSDARAQRDALSAAIAAEEARRDAHAEARFEAHRAEHDIERLRALYERLTTEAARVDALNAQAHALTERLRALREGSAANLRRLNAHFDAIARRLVGEGARAALTLSERAIDAHIDLGGDRSTAAIDSLKALAFDLTALVLTIEGHTGLPPFLLHDSPREADLGLTAYHAIFELAQTLEARSPTPLFQYILTTTTQPPPHLCREPWLRLTLRGAPASERLLGVDL